MRNVFTRMASLVLAFGLFFGCNSSKSLLNHSDSSLSKSEYQKALDSANQSIRENPDDPDAYYFKGNILYDMAQNRTSVSDRTSIYREMREALMTARKLYKDQKKAGEKKKNIRTLITNSWKHEYNTGLQLLNADSTGSSGRTELAISHFNNALAIKPDTLVNYENKAKAFYRLDNLDMAIQTLEEANQRIAQPQPRNLERLAYLYLENNNFQKAITLYEQAEKGFPQDMNLLHGLTNAYIQTGRHAKAVKLLNRLTRKDPEQPLYRLTLGTELYYLGSTKLDTLKMALDTTEPHDTLNVEEQGLKKAADSLLSRAEQQLIAADSLEDNNAEIAFTIGSYYKNTAGKLAKLKPNLTGTSREQLDRRIREDLEKALPHLQEATRLDDDRKEYWASLYQVYEYLGMDQKAEKARKKAGI